ncbi:hypothetical protein [Flavobacterium sp.]|uniref:hypothetical protein n=1 Tax=Flavobacterium sp. TaxID=239 RepID=UPI003D6B8C58
MKKVVLIISIGLLACKHKEPQSQPNSFYKEVIKSNDVKTITQEEAKTYHEDKEYQYEYRTGTSGHYEYNYEVSGRDQNGNEVKGMINIEGKYGAGIIINKDGDSIEISAEWIKNGQLKAKDKKENEYELTAN